MFTSPVLEREEAVIPIQNVSADIFKDVVSYIYTGEIHLTNENIQDTMVAGNMLELPYLIDKCSEYMKSELCFTNCVEIFLFASHYSCISLKEAAIQFIRERFKDLSKNAGDPGLYDLDLEDFVDLVASDDIAVDREEDVFGAIINWVSKDSGRETHIGRLFRNMRLPLLNRDFIKHNIEANALIQGNAECKAHLRKYYRYMEEVMNNTGDVVADTTPRTGMFCRPMLVFSGGAESKDQRSLTAFDPYTFKNYMGVAPHPTFDLKSRVDHFQLVTVQNSDVYFIGGIFFDDHHLHDSGPALSSVLQYDMKTNSWEPKSDMRIARCCFSACVHGRRIYVTGGKPQFPRGAPTESVEMYDSDADTWQNVSPLPVAIYAHASNVARDAIYLVGGKDEDDDFLDTVFRYEIATDSWSLVTIQLPKPRAFSSAFYYKSKLYVIGGASLYEHMASVIVYDIDKNEIKFGTEFPEERKITAAGFYDGTIFVCGGVRQLGLSGRRGRQVESRDLYKYDTTEDSWAKVVRLVQYGNTNSVSFANLNAKFLTESDFVSSL